MPFLRCHQHLVFALALSVCLCFTRTHVRFEMIGRFLGVLIPALLSGRRVWDDSSVPERKRLLRAR